PPAGRPPYLLVHVERAGDLPEEPRAPAFLLGALDRPGELLGQLVHAFFQRLHDRIDPFVALPPRPSRAKGNHHHEGEEAAAEGRNDDDQIRVHRRKVRTVVAVWWVP